MKNIIEKNLYLNNSARTVLLYRYNKEVNEFIKEASHIDSIRNFERFKNFIEIFKNKYNGGIYSVKKSYSESLLYGHINMMSDYAGIEKKDFIYFPVMEHGIQFYMQIKQNQPPRIFQGDYFLDDWRSEYKNTPLYVIGPYVHYADKYYNENNFTKLRLKYKKTLLVFPSHSYELAETNYNEKQFVDYVMDRLAKDYDTVMVCAYWADLNHEVYSLFKSRGAVIVSAGFRGDFNFIKRLKSIIMLSDCVVSNALGTFLGYAVYLDKPVIMIDGNVVNDIKDMTVTEEMSDKLSRIQGQFMREFAPLKEPLNDEQIKLCNKYWGLDKTKTPEEIRVILKVNKMVIKGAGGKIRRIGKSAIKVLNSDNLSECEHRILKEAMGIKDNEE